LGSFADEEVDRTSIDSFFNEKKSVGVGSGLQDRYAILKIVASDG
jgi:hypothetical protein